MESQMKTLAQQRIPRALHELMVKAKSDLIPGVTFNWSEWQTLGYLVLLTLRGECPDEAFAEVLCGGPSRVTKIFGRIQRGEL